MPKQRKRSSRAFRQVGADAPAAVKKSKRIQWPGPNPEPPPLLDMTLEEAAQAMFKIKGPLPDMPVVPAYYCAVCKQRVRYPEILYRDGCCEQCHAAQER